MLRSCLISCALPAFALVLACSPADAESGAAAPRGVGIALEDFAYIDTSGESDDQQAKHREQLKGFMAALRRDFAADRQSHVVPVSCGAPCQDVAPADLVRAAADAGARIVVVGGVHKVSTLVQWAQVQTIDVETQSVVFNRLFSFRGDSDQAWEKAEVFVSREIRAELAAKLHTSAPAPIALAIFDFELEDTSAGASPSGATPSDTARLADVTNEVRRLFGKSGRYRLIDVSNADAPAVTAHTLRDCNGCDADIALKLGAEQSFVGVVTRVSRTEYGVKFQIRDTRTGAVVSEADSGLRMGADYSWSRGAAALIKGQALETGVTQ